MAALLKVIKETHFNLDFLVAVETNLLFISFSVLNGMINLSLPVGSIDNISFKRSFYLVEMNL